MHCGTLPDFRRPVPFIVRFNQSQTMKKLNSLLAITLCLLSCLLLNSGCQTAGSTDSLPRVLTAAKLASYIGVSEYLRVHPETKPAFLLAVQSLKQIEASTTVDLVTLLAVVNQLPTKELRSERAQMFITSATILIADFGGQLPIEKLNELKPVATAIREGIELALN
jgi:hypothetical protein